MKRKFDDSLVVIPSSNGASALKVLLSSLDVPYDCVLVLDQGNTDNTADICKEMGIEIIHIGAPKKYLQCCSVALDIANMRKKNFLYILNDSVRFMTKVAHELMSEMLRDQNLAIVSPSQLIVDELSNKTFFSSRAKWDLENIVCDHDFTLFNSAVDRVEADYCQLSCALIRVGFLNEVGGFDDQFDLCFGGADVAYRLRLQGRSLAYLQQAQIEILVSSRMSGDLSQNEFQEDEFNKKHFSMKHLGFGAEYKDHGSTENHSWNIINKNLYPCMRRHGLIDKGRPELIFGHPGADPYDYLFTVWETSALPLEWRKYQQAYKVVCAPSKWNVELLRKNGFRKTYYVPLGMETDTYTPFGPSQREFDSPVYLWFARNQYRKGLDILLKVWAEFRSVHTNARLIVMGHDVLSGMSTYRHQMRRVGKFVTLDLSADRVYFRQIVSPLSDAEVALTYRSVDYLVCTSRSEGFGFSIAEAMACGLTPIFPHYSSLADFVVPHSLCFGGTIVRADYLDKGFDDVGDWWEPDQANLLACLKSTIQEDASLRAERVASGLNLLRNQFTWRNTCFSFRTMLGDEQRRRDISSKPRSHMTAQVLDVSSELVAREQIAETNVRSHIDAGFSTEAAAAFADFDSSTYSEINYDVKESGMNGLSHFIKFGFRENRAVSHGVNAVEYLKLNAIARRYIIQENNLRNEKLPDNVELE
jgi:glycosyltransferase involved in cell wall biosynthesis